MKKKLLNSKSNLNKSDRKTLFEKKYIAVLLIIIVSVVVYFNSINIPFIFDDIKYIVENSAIKQLSNIGIELIKTYRPLTFITFAFNYYFGELNTLGYHIFNISIHIISSILIFFLIRKIIFYSYNKFSFLFSLFASLIFAVHPINTEVVTHIYNRSASLSTLFYLLSLLLFIKSVEGKKISILYQYCLLYYHFCLKKHQLHYLS